MHGDTDVLEANSIGLVVLHEIEHNLHGPKSDYNGPDPGEVERDYINPIRAELGLPQRQIYSPRTFSKNAEEYNYLTYKVKDKTLKILSWKKSQVEKVRK
jgi:hypothetical protein